LRVQFASLTKPRNREVSSKVVKLIMYFNLRDGVSEDEFLNTAEGVSALS